MRWHSVMVCLAAGVLLVGCGKSASSDQPALAVPTTEGATITQVTTVGGPTLVVRALAQVEEPQLSPAPPSVNAALRRQAAALSAGDLACTVSASRLDATVGSFRWICTPIHGRHAGADQQVSTATFDLADGRQLTLADLFTGGWLPVLAATARTQLETEGTSAAAAAVDVPATIAGFSMWALDADDLDVTFLVGGKPTTVQFPIESLAAYLPSGGLLKA